VKLKKNLASVLSEIKKVEEELSSCVYTDKKTWSRLLIIVIDLLTHTTKDLKHPGIEGLLNSTLLPSFRIENDQIRELAVKSLGLYCMLNKEVAQTHLDILIKSLCHDTTIIQVTAVKVIFDLLMLYEDLLPTDNNEQETKMSMKKLVNIFTAYLQITVEEEKLPEQELVSLQEMRCLVVEGVAKLAIYNRVRDYRILAHFLLLHFHPTTVTQPRLRQILSAFFVTYINSDIIQSEMDPNYLTHKELFFEAFLPTLKVVAYAPKSSHLNKIPLTTISQFMISLLVPSGKSMETKTEKKKRKKKKKKK